MNLPNILKKLFIKEKDKPSNYTTILIPGNYCYVIYDKKYKGFLIGPGGHITNKISIADLYDRKMADLFLQLYPGRYEKIKCPKKYR